MELIVTIFFGFLAGAILVETLTEIIGDWIPAVDGKTTSIFIGMLVAFYANFNILEMVGLEYGWTGNQIMDIIGIVVGIVFSGLILSRGSNGVHDLFEKLKAAKELEKAEGAAIITADMDDGKPVDEDLI